jgi:hypothetical protein
MNNLAIYLMLEENMGNFLSSLKINQVLSELCVLSLSP